jgi:hypothetical protein
LPHYSDMKNITWAFFIISIFVLTACNNRDEDPYLNLQQRAAIMEGEWKLSSYKINGKETSLFLDTIKRKQASGCDTQTIYRYDALDLFIVTFSKNGGYWGDKYINRTDTSFLRPSITDTACTNKYNYIKEPFDTIINLEGFWKFVGTTVKDADNERLMLYDRKTKESQLWDVLLFSTDEIRLFRQFYKDTSALSRTIEEWQLLRL